MAEQDNCWFIVACCCNICTPVATYFETFIMAAKKIIIIGASSGIGAAMTAMYAQQHLIIGITGRRNEMLLQLQQRFPQQVHTECFDVMGNNNIYHLKALIEKLGGMDLLIYNAGYGEISKTLDPVIEKETTLTNVNGFIELTAFAFNYFVQQGYGQIVATSSIASKRGNSMAPAYSASKAFMSTYMEGLHMKVKKTPLPQIYITDVQPGFVATKMAKGAGRFWEAPVEKAAAQMVKAIDKKKFRVYITKRWWIFGKLMPLLPNFIYHRIG
jgi:short-subunit dehydrogenase